MGRGDLAPTIAHISSQRDNQEGYTDAQSFVGVGFPNPFVTFPNLWGEGTSPLRLHNFITTRQSGGLHRRAILRRGWVPQPIGIELSVLGSVDISSQRDNQEGYTDAQSFVGVGFPNPFVTFPNLWGEGTSPLRLHTFHHNATIKRVTQTHNPS